MITSEGKYYYACDPSITLPILILRNMNNNKALQKSTTIRQKHNVTSKWEDIQKAKMQIHRLNSYTNFKEVEHDNEETWTTTKHYKTQLPLDKNTMFQKYERIFQREYM